MLGANGLRSLVFLKIGGLRVSSFSLIIGLFFSSGEWVLDLNGDGVFQVKDVRSMLDEAFLPKMEVPTRGIKRLPIKVNVFGLKLYRSHVIYLLDRIGLVECPLLPSLACPLCDHECARLSPIYSRLLCGERYLEVNLKRWWNLNGSSFYDRTNWLSWFQIYRFSSKRKKVWKACFTFLVRPLERQEPIPF
ncbi:hypothetical protein Tco_0435582 [Tanacetum coccineum]